MRWVTSLVVVVGLWIAFPAGLFAQGTRTWEQSRFEDLSKGSARGVAVRSSGGLELAPSIAPLAPTPATYIWSLATDPEGNVYAATGSPAKVYRITPDGKTSVIFESSELQVQSLAAAKDGSIFAATNPDGKVYRIERRSGSSGHDKTSGETSKSTPWNSSLYFDPGQKYIWNLALDEAGNLFVATGDQGEIFRVDPKGEHSLFFKSDEVHIRVLELDGRGHVIAGSDGNGLIYRISSSGEAFVLYSASRKEITALAIDTEGNIFAAGTGDKHAASSAPSSFSVPANGGSSSLAFPGLSSVPVITGSNAPVSVAGTSSTGVGASGGSEVYRIGTDGSPRRLWTSRDELVYALAFGTQGQLLAGTGNHGKIFSIDGEDDYADLLKVSASQITAFAKAPGGGLWVATSNPGKVFGLGNSSGAEGSYESDVFDAHIFSRWGRVEFRGAGNVELFARSGNVDNPDRNWSPWASVDLKGKSAVSAPAARFVQWKAVLHPGSPAAHVDSVTLNYLPQNVAPIVDEVKVQVGVSYQPTQKLASEMTPGGAHFDTPPSDNHERNSIGVKWNVRDDNDDQMVYSIYYRGDGDSRWLLLKDGLTDKFYSFDASLLPDGSYTVRVLASDAPSHSPGEALAGTKDSARFEVDTTPPQIRDLEASETAAEFHVTFRATDNFSVIKKAEFSVDAGDWQFISPVGQISDSKTESYDFRVRMPQFDSANASGSDHRIRTGATEHIVVVRVYDRYDNVSSAKTTMQTK